MIRRLLLTLAIALPIGAAASPPREAIPGDEPPPRETSRGLGLTLEGILAGLYEDDPQGSPFVRKTGWGLRVGWDLSRRVGLGDTPWTLQPELQWTSRTDTEGTKAVTVERRLDSFYLGARFGWRFGPETAGWRWVPYLAAGPAATWNHVQIDVADPVEKHAGAASISRDVNGLQWGVGYGAGIGAAWLSDDGDGITGRIELLRFHRSYLEELALAFGLGLAF